MDFKPTFKTRQYISVHPAQRFSQKPIYVISYLSKNKKIKNLD